MESIIKVLFSPIAFAIGFLWPLVTQVLMVTGLATSGWPAWVASAALVLPFALMAQFKGSWVWIK